MSTDERNPGRAPLYARLLRLRRLKITGLVSFLLLECTIAVAVLLALAELVSWWAVPLLPVLVGAVVKINDMVVASSRRPVRTAVGGARHDDPDDLHDRYRADGYTDDRFGDGGYDDDGYEPADRRDEHPATGHERHADPRRDDPRRDDRGWDERRLDRNWNDRHRGRRPERIDEPVPVAAPPVDERVPAYAGARLPDDATQEMSLPSTLTGRPRQRQGGYGESYEQQAAFVTDSYAAPAPVSAAETAEFSIADLDVALAAGDPRAATGPAGQTTPGEHGHPAQAYHSPAYPVREHGAEQYGPQQHGAEQYGAEQYGVQQYGGQQYQGPRYQGQRYANTQYEGRQYEQYEDRRPEQYGGQQYTGQQYAGQQYAGPSVPTGPAGYGYGAPAPDASVHDGSVHDGSVHGRSVHGGSVHDGSEWSEAGRHAAFPDTVTLDPAALGSAALGSAVLGPTARAAAPHAAATPGTGTGGSLAAAGDALTSGRGGFTTGVPAAASPTTFSGGPASGGRASGFAERQPGTRPRFGGPEAGTGARSTPAPEGLTRNDPAGPPASDDRPREGSRAAGYWTRAAGEGGSGSGDRQRPAEGGIPTGLPGSGAPRRVQILGTAVRRSMAVQAQQFGVGGSGRGTTRGNGTRGGAESARGGAQSGSPGANHGGGHGNGNGRTARDTGQEPGGGNTSGRHARGETVVRFNERGFSRLRDA